jgi:hypothetical protein
MRLLLFIFPVIFVFGCIRDNKIPKGILSQNEMRKVMWDLMRADAYVSEVIMKDSTCNQKAESAILHEKVFSIHSITEETFRKSVAFYESRPDLLKTVMDSLRSDEKKVQEYQNYIKRPEADTTLRKNRINQKPGADTAFRKDIIKKTLLKQ